MGVVGQRLRVVQRIGSLKGGIQPGGIDGGLQRSHPAGRVIGQPAVHEIGEREEGAALLHLVDDGLREPLNLSIC